VEYVIGVDAGGTKTSAKAYGLDGCCLASYQCGPGNGTVGFDRAAENILASIEGCRAVLDGQCVFICIGMAGLDPVTVPGRLKGWVATRLAIDCEVISDAELALASAHGGGDGLLVIAGTGSIAYGQRDSKVLRRGGWGHLLGDCGSGYDIAIRAIKAALSDFDDGLPESPLAQRLYAAAGVNRLRALVEHVYQVGKEGVAALAPVVVDAALGGNEQACALLWAAGVSLAELAAALSVLLGLEKPRVAMAGGILEQVQMVRAIFTERLLQLVPGATLCQEKLEPQRAVIYRYHNRKGM
jgi:N-acetylglucosamine kinase-like BadF-type ATPase